MTSSDLYENLESFFVATNGGQVTRRIGKHFDANKEQDGEYALECEQESPANIRESVVDER